MGKFAIIICEYIETNVDLKFHKIRENTKRILNVKFIKNPS